MRCVEFTRVQNEKGRETAAYSSFVHRSEQISYLDEALQIFERRNANAHARWFCGDVHQFARTERIGYALPCLFGGGLYGLDLE